MSVLRQAADAGLDPADYSLDLTTGHAPAEARAEFDASLDRVVSAYAHDIQFGRIDPRALGLDLAPRSPPLDEATLVSRLAVSSNSAAALRELEPALPIYARLREALVRERALLAHDWPPLPTGPRILEPGMEGAWLPALAARLVLLGDLPAAALLLEDYGASLPTAVARFQARHGLLADGRVGPATRAELDVPPAARLEQIRLSLERLRWLSVTPGMAPIVVNVPEYRLRAIGDDGRVALTMNVVVGKSLGRQTPLFSAALEYVVFQPDWTVPLSIARNEIVPRATKDPDYLARNGFEIVRVDPRHAGTIAALAAVARGTATLRQKPGRGNALGRVKFVFPNSHSVYLHDTPAQALFERAKRDFSHGCIRVADPAALAIHVLRKDPSWAPARVVQALADERTVRVRVSPAIPVHIVYLTAVVTEKHELRFFDDVYGHDATLARALVARRARNMSAAGEAEN